MPKNPRQVIYDMEIGAHCIPLTRGQFALVDADEVAFLTQGPWFAKKTKPIATYYAEHQARIGVSRYRNQWAAYIRVDGRNLRLGVFSTVPEAAAAYEKASLMYHGEYGRTDSGSNLTRQSV